MCEQKDERFGAELQKSFPKLKIAGPSSRNCRNSLLACGTVVTGKPSELNRHLSACKEIGLSDQLVALTHATAKGASSASSSGQQNKLSSPMKKYLDKAAIGPHEMRRLQLLLALCFVMCGWSFRSVESPFLTQFCQNLRPNFECPSKCKACFVPQQVRPMHATTLGSSSESFDISALL